MLSRALSLAAVTVLIGGLAVIPVRAQNLEAGKSPSQIFAGTCTACHKSPRGLLKTVPASSLPGFLRQHYTTSGEMASLLSAFLVSNGATDSRYVGSKPTQQPKDAKPPAPEQLDRQGRTMRPAAAPPQEAARPDADGIAPQTEPGTRQGRKRLARPGEAPDGARPADGQAPAQAAGESGPAGRKSAAKEKLSKRGKPGAEEPPKAGAATGAAEPPKGETAKEDAPKSDAPKGESAKGESPKSETAKDEAGKPEAAKPSGEGKSESGKADAAKETGGETPALRSDPVPAVTPAPPAAPASEAAGSGTPEPVASPSASAPPAAVAPTPPPAETASVPPPPPAAPAGTPVPPISH
jgi:hypothetical protein